MPAASLACPRCHSTEDLYEVCSTVILYPVTATVRATVTTQGRDVEPKADGERIVMDENTGTAGLYCQACGWGTSNCVATPPPSDRDAVFFAELLAPVLCDACEGTGRDTAGACPECLGTCGRLVSTPEVGA